MSKDRMYFASLHKCNEDCLFCVRRGDEEPVEYLNTKESKEEISKIAREDWQTLEFDGGEPTLRKDLPELIRHAKREGIEDICILTNAVALSNKNWAEKIVEALESDIGEPNFSYSFSVSLHSHKKKVSEYLTNSKETFEKTLQGIRNLIELGAEVSIYHIMTRQNYKDLPEFIDFLREKFPAINFIVFSFIYPAGAALNNKQIFPQLSKLEPYLMETLQKCEREGINYNLSTCGTLPLCYLKGYEYITINQQRLDRPENVGLLDSKKKARYKLATDEFHEKSKVKSKKCELCYLNSLCGGLWGVYADLFGVDELQPITNTEDYREITITPENLEKIDKINNKKDIIFLEPKKMDELSEEGANRLLNKLQALKDREINYLVKKPLPLHKVDITTKEMKELRVPLNCKECLDLFKSKDGKIITCNGASLKKENISRSKIYKKFKNEVKKGNLPDCWMTEHF